MTKIDEQGKTLIMHCIIQRLTEDESIAFLEAHNYTISKQTLRRQKQTIRAGRFKQMREIADTGYIDYHLDAIHTINWAKKEMVANYYKQKQTDPYKATEILTQIVNLAPILSEYIAESKQVMERKVIAESEEIKETNTLQSTS